MIEAGAETFAGAIPTILKVNSANSLARTKEGRARRSPPASRTRCGWAAPRSASPSIRAATPPSPDGGDRRAGREAKAAGLAVVVWSYPRGGNLSQGSRDRDRHLRLCRAHGGAAGRAHHQGEAADRASRLEAAKKVYERKDRHLDPGQARRARRAVLLRRQAHRRVLGRRGEGPRRRLRRGPRHARRRRQRLDHRPQHLPAAEGRGAQDARHHHPHLSGEA